MFAFVCINLELGVYLPNQEYSMFQYGSACESHSVVEQGNLFKPQASHYCSGTSRHTVQ